MSAPTGERDAASPPATEAAPASIGFALAFEAGRALLRLVDRILLPGVALRTADFQIPDVSFPLDVTGGADRFQHRRLTLHALHLELDLRTLASMLARQLQASGVSLARWRTEQGVIAIEGFVGDAVTGGFVAHVALGPLRGLLLRVQIFDVACLGAASVTPTLVAEALLGALPESAEPSLVNARVVDLGELLLQPLLVDFGWKRAAASAVDVEQVRVDEDRVHVLACGELVPSWYSAQPLARPTAMLQRGARAMAHDEQLAPLRHLLAQGQLAAAMREARALVDRFADDDAVVACAIEALGLDASGSDEASELFGVARERADLAVLGSALRLARGAEEQLRTLGDLAAAAQRLGLSVLARRAHDARGWAALQVDRALDALEAFEAALAVGGDDERALRGAFEACRALGRLADAVRFGERSLRAAIAPDRELAVAVGELHLVQGDPERARRAFRRALREGPRADALLGLARVAVATQDPTRAVSLLGAAAAAATEVDDRATLRIALAERARFQLQALDDAAGAYRSAQGALEMGATDLDLVLLAARAADRLHDNLAARALFERTLQLTEQPALRAYASYRLGSLLLEAGEPTQAEQHLASAVSLADALPSVDEDALEPAIGSKAREALLRLRAAGGDLIARADLCLLEAGRSEDAAQKAAALLGAARCFLELGRRSAALEGVLDAIELQPELADRTPELQILIDGADVDGLRFVARRLEALVGRPSFATGALRVARALRARGALDDAEAVLRRAVDQGDPPLELLLERADVARARRDLDALDSTLQQLAAVAPGVRGLQALVERARLLAGPRGAPSLAIEVFEAALARGGDPDLQLELAAALGATGDLGAAVATLEHAVTAGAPALRIRAARELCALQRARADVDAELAAARVAEESGERADVQNLDRILEQHGHLEELVNRLAARRDPGAIRRAVELAAHRLDHLELALDCVSRLARLSAADGADAADWLLAKVAHREPARRDLVLSGILSRELLPARRLELVRARATVLARELADPAQAGSLYQELYRGGERDRELLLALRGWWLHSGELTLALQVAGELSELDVQATAPDTEHLVDHRIAAELARQADQEALEVRYLERQVEAAQGKDVVVEPPLLPQVLRLVDLYAVAGRHEDQSRTLARAVLHCRDDAARIGLFKRIAELEEHTLARPELAAQALERVLRLDPVDEDAAAALSRLYEFLGLVEPMVALHRELALHAQVPAQRAALLITAGDAVALSDVHRACRLYLAAMDAAPESRAALEHISVLARHQGSHSMLVRGYLHSARRREGASAAPLLEEAGAILAGLLVRPRFAALVLARAVVLAPSRVSAALALVEVARACPDPDRALEVLGWLHQLDGLAATPRLEATLAHAEVLRLFEGDGDEVWALYRQALQLSPDNLRALDALLVHSAATGLLEEYQTLLARRLQRSDRHATSLHLHAAERLQQDAPIAAREHLQAVLGDAALDAARLDEVSALARTLAAPELLARSLSRRLQEPGVLVDQERAKLLRELACVLGDQLHDPDGEISAWQALVELAPDDVEARIALGERLLALGRAEPAAIHLDRALQAEQVQRQPEMWERAALLRAGLAEQQGDDPRVTELLRGLCERHPDDRGLRIRLAAALERGGQAGEAAHWLEQAVDLAAERGDRAYLLLRWARMLERSGALAPATSAFMGVVAADPAARDAWLGATRCALACGDGELRAMVERAVEDAGAPVEGARERRGRLLLGALAAGDAGDAQRWLDSLGDDEVMLCALRPQLDRLAELGLGDAVERVVERWSDGADPAAWRSALRLRARLRLDAGDRAGAIADLGAAWEQVGDDAALLEALVAVLLQAQDQARAQMVLVQGALRCPDPARAVTYLQRWQALGPSGAGDDTDAAVLERWLALDPGDVRPRVALVALYYQAGRWEALLHALLPLELSTLDAGLHAQLAWQRGEAAWRVGDEEHAHADLSLAYALQPERPGLEAALQQRAIQAFIASEHAGRDLAALVRALEIVAHAQPDHAEWQWQLIEALSAQGEHARAAEVARAAAHAIAGASAIPFFARWLDEAGEDLDAGAAQTLRAWLERDPAAERARWTLVRWLDPQTATDELLRHLGWLAANAQELPARVQALTDQANVGMATCRVADAQQALLQLADLAQGQGDAVRELELLQRWLALSSEQPAGRASVLRRVAELARRRDDRVQAREALQQLVNIGLADEREHDELATLCLEAGETERAASLLVAAARLATDPRRIAFLIERWSPLGVPLPVEQELDLLARWSAADPTALSPAMRSAVLLSATGRWAEALPILRRVDGAGLVGEPSSEIDELLAEAAAQCHDLETELTARRRLAERAPARPTLEALATLLERAGRPAEAGQALTRALELDGSTDAVRAEMLSRLASLRQAAGDVDGALAAVLDAVPLCADPTDLIQRGYALVARFDDAARQDQLDQLTERRAPGWGDPGPRRARLLQRALVAGQHDQARHWLGLLREVRASTDALVELARLAGEWGAPDVEEGLLAAIIASSAEDSVARVDALQRRAGLHEAKADFGAAIADLQLVAGHNSSSSTTQDHLVELLHGSGRSAEACQLLLRLVGQAGDPARRAALYRRWWELGGLQDPGSQRAVLEAWSQVQPPVATPLQELVALELAAGQLSDARAHLHTLDQLGIDPATQRVVWQQLLDVSWQLGDAGAVVQLAAELEREAPLDPEQLERRIACLVDLERFDEAATLLEQRAGTHLDMDARRQDLLRAGELWRDGADRPERALPLFEALHREAPQDRALMASYAELLEAGGRFEDQARLLCEASERATGLERRELRRRAAELLETELHEVAGAANLLDMLVTENPVDGGLREWRRRVLQAAGDQHRLASALTQDLASGVGEDVQVLALELLDLAVQGCTTPRAAVEALETCRAFEVFDLGAAPRLAQVAADAGRVDHLLTLAERAAEQRELALAAKLFERAAAGTREQGGLERALELEQRALQLDPTLTSLLARVVIWLQAAARDDELAAVLVASQPHLDHGLAVQAQAQLAALHARRGGPRAALVDALEALARRTGRSVDWRDASLAALAAGDHPRALGALQAQRACRDAGEGRLAQTELLQALLLGPTASELLADPAAHVEAQRLRQAGVCLEAFLDYPALARSWVERARLPGASPERIHAAVRVCTELLGDMALARDLLDRAVAAFQDPDAQAGWRLLRAGLAAQQGDTSTLGRDLLASVQAQPLDDEVFARARDLASASGDGALLIRVLELRAEARVGDEESWRLLLRAAQAAAVSGDELRRNELAQRLLPVPATAPHELLEQLYALAVRADDQRLARHALERMIERDATDVELLLATAALAALQQDLDLADALAARICEGEAGAAAAGWRLRWHVARVRSDRAQTLATIDALRGLEPSSHALFEPWLQALLECAQELGAEKGQAEEAARLLLARAADGGHDARLLERAEHWARQSGRPRLLASALALQAAQQRGTERATTLLEAAGLLPLASSERRRVLRAVLRVDARSVEAHRACTSDAEASVETRLAHALASFALSGDDEDLVLAHGLARATRDAAVQRDLGVALACKGLRRFPRQDQARVVAEAAGLRDEGRQAEARQRLVQVALHDAGWGDRLLQQLTDAGLEQERDHLLALWAARCPPPGQAEVLLWQARVAAERDANIAAASSLVEQALELDHTLDVPASVRRAQRAQRGDPVERAWFLEHRLRLVDERAPRLTALRQLHQLYSAVLHDEVSTLRCLTQLSELEPTDLLLAAELVEALRQQGQPVAAAQQAARALQTVHTLATGQIPFVARLLPALRPPAQAGPGARRVAAILGLQLGLDPGVIAESYDTDACLCAALCDRDPLRSARTWGELRRRAEDDRDPARALAAAELAFCADPRGEHRDQLEAAYTAAQEYQRLAAAYEHEVASLQEPARRASLHFNLAGIYLEHLKRSVRARRHLRAAAALSPEDSIILRSRVEVERLHGTPAALADALEDLAATASPAQAAALLVEAGLALVDVDAERACALLEQSVQTQPRQFEAQVALGHLYERAGNSEGAIVCYEVAAELASEAPHAQQLQLKIGRLAEHGLDDRALALRSYLAAADAGNLLALASAERIARAIDDRFTLEQVLGRRAVATQNGEVRRDLLLERATLLSSLGRLREARLVLDGLVQERPDDARVLTQAGALLESWRLLAPAVELYQRALDLPPAQLDEAQRRALERDAMALLAVAGEWPRAVALARQVMAREPHSEAALAVLEAGARVLGDTDLLLRVLPVRLEQATLPAQRVALRLELAGTLERAGHLDEAAGALHDALDDEGDEGAASRALFDVHAARGDLAAQARIASRLCERFRDDAAVPRWLRVQVEAARADDDVALAARLLQQLLRRDPQDAQAYDDLWQLLQGGLEQSVFAGFALMGRKKLREPEQRARLAAIEAELRIEASDDDRALEALRDGLADCPGHPLLLQGLRGVAGRRGHQEWLVAPLEAAVEQAASDTLRAEHLRELARILGEVLVDESRTTQALRRLLELRPDDQVARAQLADLRYQAQAYAETWSLLREAPEAADPDAATARRLMLAECARNLGDLPGYEEMLRRALDGDPLNATALEALALHLTATDRAAEGRDLILAARMRGAALSRTADLHWRKTEAEELARQGNLELAVDKLWQVHELEPHDAEVLRALARHLGELDRVPMLAEALRRLAPLERSPEAQVDRYCEAAEALLEDGDAPAASRVFSQATDVDARSARALSGRAHAALAMHDGRRFGEWARRLLEVEPGYRGSAAFHAALADALRADGSPASTILVQLDLALEQAPADREVQLAALETAGQAGNALRQVQLLERLLENAEGAEEIHLRAATAARIARDALGDRRRAIGLMYRAHAANPAELGVKKELALLYLAEPATQREARTALAQLIADDVTDVTMLRDLARLDRARGEGLVAEMLDELAAYVAGELRAPPEQPRFCARQPLALDQMLPRDWPRAEHQLLRIVTGTANAVLAATRRIPPIISPLSGAIAAVAPAHLEAVDRFLAGPELLLATHIGEGIELNLSTRQVALGQDILEAGELGLRAGIAEAAARARWSTQLASLTTSMPLETLVALVLDALSVPHALKASDEVHARLASAASKLATPAVRDAAIRAAAQLREPLDRRRLGGWREMARQLTARAVLSATGSMLPALALLTGVPMRALLEEDNEARLTSLRRRETRLLVQFATSDVLTLLAKAEPSR